MTALDGGAGSCPLAATPLSALCDVASTLTDAIGGGGGENLLTVLQGALATLFASAAP